MLFVSLFFLALLFLASLIYGNPWHCIRALHRTLLLSDSLFLLQASNLLGAVCEQQGRHQEAVSHYGACLALVRASATCAQSQFQSQLESDADNTEDVDVSVDDERLEKHPLWRKSKCRFLSLLVVSSSLFDIICSLTLLTAQ